MILLAFFAPLAIYLILLGLVNRRQYPVLVPGPWDFAGLLLAASGFLLCGGPALLTSVHERVRWFWLLGPRSASPDAADTGLSLGGFLALVYFVTVVAGSAYLLRRQRNVTAVYNVEADQAERALDQACARLSLNPVRSGNLLLFAPAHTRSLVATTADPSARQLFGQRALLEVDAFPALRHVSLRWDPAGADLRRALEAELGRILARTPTPDHPVGNWLLLAGISLLGFSCLGAFALILFRLVQRV